MGYPNLPKNRLIVNGVDLSERFKMVLADGYTLTPPSPKTYVVNIPGGNGKLDLTESLLGDVSYDNRKQEFQFYIIDVANFEKTKTDISNFLHGREFDYQMTMDPGYTYHGRFTISSYTHKTYDVGIVGVIKLTIDAKPFKYREDKVVRVDAIGGQIIYLESGRKPVRPTIESDGYVKVIYNNKLVRLPQGSWSINDLMLRLGTNELYVNSFDVRSVLWSELKESTTWGSLKDKRLFEWYKLYGVATWKSLNDTQWSECSEVTWSKLRRMYEPSWDVRDVYIKYEWGDL